MSRSPLPVSVVIPAYQAAPSLPATLRSVRDQTVPVDEVVVVDDGSEDETARLAEAADANVIRHDVNRGLSAARNTGIRKAQNEWIALLDADDLWKPRKMERQWGIVERHRNVEVVFSDREHVRDGKVVRDRYLSDYGPYRSVERTELEPGVYRLDGDSLGEALFPGNFLKSSTLLVRKEIVRKVGCYDESFHTPGSLRGGCEDQDISLRLSLATDPVVVEEPLVTYRLRDGSLSSDSIGMNLGYVHLASNILEQPENYPAGAAAYFRERRPDWLHSAAVGCMHDDRFELAASLLRRSLRDRFSLRTLAALAICHLGPHFFRALLRLKRAAGLPGLR